MGKKTQREEKEYCKKVERYMEYRGHWQQSRTEKLWSGPLGGETAQRKWYILTYRAGDTQDRKEMPERKAEDVFKDFYWDHVL